MKDLFATSIKYQQGCLYALDQHQLPHKERWLPCNDADSMIEMIKKLQIRGAPLIGIGASLLLAHLAEQGYSADALKIQAARLRAARPTAVNLMNCIDRMLAALSNEGSAGLSSCAEQIFEEDVELCNRLASLGAELIGSRANILTHCNTGSLATAGVGTAIGVISAAQQLGKQPHVWVDETRPLLQGGRLTTWEMARLNIAHTLICDNMAASLMAQGKVDLVLVGSDRIAANGDFANKTGTYALAVIAQYHKVPFYVVAPYTTVDANCLNGSAIPIEHRSPVEVQGIRGNFGTVNWTPDNTPVYNPAFDITPAELVSGWILDSGIYTAEQVRSGALIRR